MGHIYAAPYALLEPDFALVMDDDDGVAGFALGTADTAAWFQRLESHWWPSLRAMYQDPGDVSVETWSADQRRAVMIHHPIPTPRQITGRYPAHMHLNLASRIQGRGRRALKRTPRMVIQLESDFNLSVANQVGVFSGMIV